MLLKLFVTDEERWFNMMIASLFAVKCTASTSFFLPCFLWNLANDARHQRGFKGQEPDIVEV